MKTNEEMDNFVGYLRGTLIPDLEDSGSKATAEDFATAAEMIEDLRSGEDKPKGTPKILIMRQHYYGKGKTIAEAWASLRDVSGYTLRQLKKEPWVMYFGHDTESVPLHINDMGNICYHSAYPVTEIDSNLPEDKS